MVDHQYFAHEGRDGSQPAERIRATGYLSGGGAWRIGENLAWGTGDLATPAGDHGRLDELARPPRQHPAARSTARSASA